MDRYSYIVSAQALSVNVRIIRGLIRAHRDSSRETDFSGTRLRILVHCRRPRPRRAQKAGAERSRWRRDLEEIQVGRRGDISVEPKMSSSAISEVQKKSFSALALAIMAADFSKVLMASSP